MLEIKASYTPQRGFVDNGRGQLEVGGAEGAFYPYDMLLGGLSACFQSTLDGILAKKHIQPSQIDYRITGEKRKEVPTTLSKVNMEITVSGAVDQDQMLKSIDLAGKYCSIHETISKVAEITHTVNFKA